MMSNAKMKAMALLQDIPDDKVQPVIEILEGLRSLYFKHESTVMHESTSQKAMGIFNRYANIDLIPSEKEAWGVAVKEKYAVN